MDLIGNRYALERTLGAGGMGTVYKAKDTRTGGEVALKMLHPQYVGKPAYAERFRREAEIAVRIDHPNVCAGLDRGEHLGAHFLVMELLQGRSVAELVTEDGCIFDIESALSVLVQATAGLDAMLGVAGVIAHRDLSAANIFVSDDGSVKIADFGIAKLETGNETGTGSFLGNVNYMSPEQINDPKRVDARSDLYSLGVVFFEMLTGTRPFTGSPTEVATKHLHLQPPAPILSGRHAELSIRVLQNLLSKERDQRFASPRALIEYITAEMPEIRPVVARRKFDVPWKSLVAVAAVVALVMFVVPQLNKPPHRNPPDKPTVETTAVAPTWGGAEFSTPKVVKLGQDFVVRVEGMGRATGVHVASAAPGMAQLKQKDGYSLKNLGGGIFESTIGLSALSKGQSLQLRFEALDDAGNTASWQVSGISVDRDTTVKNYGVADASVNTNVARNP